MLSFGDMRSFETPDERFSHCLYCGRLVMVLPNDCRAGSCYDCLALSVAAATPCPDCAAPISGEDRGLGCAQCGWYPLRG
jgi:hypothetical protein